MRPRGFSMGGRNGAEFISIDILMGSFRVTETARTRMSVLLKSEAHRHEYPCYQGRVFFDGVDLEDMGRAGGS